jgi:hypothetical protein
MTKLTAARIATLKENGGMSTYIDRPRPGPRLDHKWCRSWSGDCLIEYSPRDDRWHMLVVGGTAKHSIAGDSSVERINAHWRRFLRSNAA